MRINKCKYDSIDEITGATVCYYPLSPNFTSLKNHYCTGIENGCKYYTYLTPMSILNIENSLPFVPIKFYPNIF